jgi:hypothetical protein
VSRFQAYVGRFDGVRGGVSSLPGWARSVVFVAAIPGLILAALSIALLLISILALLLLAAPVYSLLKQVTRTAPDEVETIGTFGEQNERRQASARVIETDVK